MSKPNCYTCKHRGTVPHSAHSSCRHPEPGKLHVEGNERGVQGGWFHWPSNFDPVWLEKCNGHDPDGAELQEHAKIIDLFEALKRSMER